MGQGRSSREKESYTEAQLEGCRGPKRVEDFQRPRGDGGSCLQGEVSPPSADLLPLYLTSIFSPKLRKGLETISYEGGGI